MATNLFLDTEFNGWGGELISLALFNPMGPSFYEVVELPSEITPWVAEHVIPVLDKDEIGRSDFAIKLRAYLATLSSPITVIADWPADFEHFFASLSIEGDWNVSVPVEARLLRSGECVSLIPHNALEDAKALYNWFCDEVTATIRAATHMAA